MKIKYCDNIILRAYRIEDLVSDIIVGTFSSIIIEKKNLTLYKRKLQHQSR